MLIKWISKSSEKYEGDVKDYISKVRNINDMDEYLNPSSKNVLSPFKIRNIQIAVERIIKAVSNKEKIVVVPDIDPDGCMATVIMVQCLQKLDADVSYIYHQRSEGHGIEHDDVPDDTELLIILDSSSSSVERCRELSETMDIIIIDHHNIEKENDAAILVNINHPECPYENKNLSATGVVWKVVEVLDYHYKKFNINHFLDLVSVTLLSDSMRVDNLENRWILKEGMKNIHNVGLLALIKASKINRVNSQELNYSVIPVLNTATRNDEIQKVFSLLFEKDYFKAKAKADWMIKENKARKERIKVLFEEYKELASVDKFILVATPTATKNYNGLVAQKLSSEYMRPALVLKDMGNTYEGSGRSYNGFDLQGFLKECPYVKYAAGHTEALGVGIDKKDWKKFKQYVNENIDESLFEPVIEYDIELNEDELDWDLVNNILEIDEVWGQGSPPITVRLNDVFVEDKELFPPTRQEHVRIKADMFDALKFNDKDYAEEIQAWDQISMIGSIGINEFNKNKRIQLFIEDYKK
ncbi:DHH family phosphoesterase [Oceanobacillus sp. FSL H7-0719]|uniref:DHH family phosphoesterase n=1 Tax=Oceanobacillus sp. FSL H7-0719 TaxID=2954507 RepID=UPI00324A7203